MKAIKCNISGRPCDVYVYNGWYVRHGCSLVNHTTDDIFEASDLCDLWDDDCFTWDKPITSLDELIKAVEY